MRSAIRQREQRTEEPGTVMRTLIISGIQFIESLRAKALKANEGN